MRRGSAIYYASYYAFLPFRKTVLSFYLKTLSVLTTLVLAFELSSFFTHLLKQEYASAVLNGVLVIFLLGTAWVAFVHNDQIHSHGGASQSIMRSRCITSVIPLAVISAGTVVDYMGHDWVTAGVETVMSLGAMLILGDAIHELKTSRHAEKLLRGPLSTVVTIVSSPLDHDAYIDLDGIFIENVFCLDRSLFVVGNGGIGRFFNRVVDNVEKINFTISVGRAFDDDYTNRLRTQFSNWQEKGTPLRLIASEGKYASLIEDEDKWVIIGSKVPNPYDHA